MPPDAPRATVTVRHRFTVPAGRVFEAWLDPRVAGRWLFATPTGERVRVEIDARVGGAFTIVERRPDGEVAHVGEYRELDRPRRLAFTFSVPKYSSESTRVALDFAPLTEGCELTLQHEDVLPEYAEQTGAGWTRLLEALDALLT